MQYDPNSPNNWQTGGEPPQPAYPTQPQQGAWDTAPLPPNQSGNTGYGEPPVYGGPPPHGVRPDMMPQGYPGQAYPPQPQAPAGQWQAPYQPPDNGRVRGGAKVMGILSLVFSLASVLLLLLIGAAPLYLPALILGIISLAMSRGRKGKAPAVIGVCVSAVLLVVALVMAFYVASEIFSMFDYLL